MDNFIFFIIFIIVLIFIIIFILIYIFNSSDNNIVSEDNNNVSNDNNILYLEDNNNVSNDNNNVSNDNDILDSDDDNNVSDYNNLSDDNILLEDNVLISKLNKILNNEDEIQDINYYLKLLNNYQSINDKHFKKINLYYFNINQKIINLENYNVYLFDKINDLEKKLEKYFKMDEDKLIIYGKVNFTDDTFFNKTIFQKNNY